MKKILWIILYICIFFTVTGFKNWPESSDGVVKSVYEDNGASTYLVGDSRIYFMRTNLKDASDFNWIAVCGSGYYHLQNEFTAILSQEDLDGKTIIIESGLNDILFGGGEENAFVNYSNFYRTTAQEFIKRGAKVMMVRLLPVQAHSEHNNKVNQVICEYNNKLADNIPDNIGIIDFSDVILGYSDELHFDSDTSLKLYFLLQEYRAKEKVISKVEKNRTNSKTNNKTSIKKTNTKSNSKKNNKNKNSNNINDNKNNRMNSANNKSDSKFKNSAAHIIDRNEHNVRKKPGGIFRFFKGILK